MSQLRYNKLLPYLIPGSVIEIEGGGGDGIPPGCSWMRANFIRIDHAVSEFQKTELAYMATVKIRSTMIESTGDSSSEVNLQLCRPEPPSENVNIISGQRIEFLMNELWMRGVIAKGKASGKNSFLVKLDDSSSDVHTFEVKKSHIRRRKIWRQSSGTWVLD